MYKIKETIIVEGVYDKIKLSGFIDGIIFVTGGFSVFNNKKMQESIRTFAEKTGLVVLTDSDSAGLKIRNFIKQLVPKEWVKHAYIPEIFGKERRKTVGGKEGLLGVEGVSEAVILKALADCGCIAEEAEGKKRVERHITKADFFALGLSGGENCAERRKKLAVKIGLPSKISANMLLDTVNNLLTYDELKLLVKEAEQEKTE